MATRVYTITIETPEAEDDFQYTATITRHGETVAYVKDCLVPMLAFLGPEIGKDLENEGVAKRPARRVWKDPAKTTQAIHKKQDRKLREKQ